MTLNWMRVRIPDSEYEFLAMQHDAGAALRRPVMRMSGEALKWFGEQINTEWYVPVYAEFDTETTVFALRPVAPFVWLSRFWEMNRWCLERALVRRIFDLPEGETYASRTLRHLRRWSFYRTDDRTGKRWGWKLSRRFIFWP